MPNIREFQTPQLGLQPTEMGVEARAATARRGGSFFNQAAADLSDTGSRIGSTIRDVGQVATDYMDHREISAGAANGAQFIANQNALWNQTVKNADPNNPSVASKFLAENLEPSLAKFRDGFNTEKSQAWAEHFVDQYRQHMFQKTSADMSTLAGVAVRQNVEKTVNGLSSAVASDPSSLDFALSAVDHSIGAIVDSSPTLDAATAASIKGEVGLKAKESIVKAAVAGMITKNPGIDLDAIQKKYGEYIKGDEMKMFQKAAQTQAKVDMLQQKQLETYQRQQDERKAETRANDTVTKNVTIDPQSGRPVINPQYFKDSLDIARMPNAPVGLARTLIDWGEHQQNVKEVVADDPTVKQGLTDRLFDPTNPTTRTDLMKAQIAGKLSDHSFQAMERLVTELETTPLKGPVWQATAAAAKDALVVTVPGIPGKDTVGTAAYSTFMQSFIPQYLAKSRAGTLEPNALDVKDPNSMISKAMAPFKRTPAQRMTDYIAGAGGLSVSEKGDVSGNVNKPVRNDVMPAIPPADQRPPGLYETPKGKMKWTGTGWVAP